MIAYSDKNESNGTRSGARSTKKDRLLLLAQREPFLSVDEIAATVETTARYVRTSLSEAGLSLTELRRRHAQDLKQRLSGEVSMRDAEGTGALLPGAFAEAGVQLTTRRVRVAQIVDADTAAMLGASGSTPLLEISRLRLTDDRPLYVNQLVTTQNLVVSEGMFTSDDKSLIQLLGLGDRDGVAFSDRTFDVVAGNDYLCQSLELPVGHPVIRCGSVLTSAGEPIAIKFDYFDGTRVRLVVSNVPDCTLRIVERDSAE